MEKIDKRTQYRYNKTHTDGVCLRYKEKYYLEGDVLVEITLFELEHNIHYPHGVKYRFIAINLTTKNRVLMDNHQPKGDHIHINNNEESYQYTSIENLFKDFRELVKIHMGENI